MVARIVDGGAAQKINQIFAGDIISRINGISVFGWALDKVLDLQSVHVFCRVSTLLNRVAPNI